MQLALPTLATVALGAALLVPLRDDRRGKRATFASGGSAPLSVDFRAIAAAGGEPDRAPLAEREPLVLRLQDLFARFVFGGLGSGAVARPGADGGDARPSDEVSHEEAATHEISADDLDDVAPDATFAERVAMLARPAVSSEPPPQPALPPLVLRAQRSPYERAVPLTRLPLRPQSNAITWSGLTGFSPDAGRRIDRHALLGRLAQDGAQPCADALLLAYREEDCEGRVLALRALMRIDDPRAERIFTEALHAGTDEERALAIDALAGLGARDALVPALGDRVEAIAAKAALAYVGTNQAADYRRLLEPHLDAARMEGVLRLLAGFLA